MTSVLGIVAFLACGVRAADVESDTKMVVMGNTRFALDLYGRLGAKDGNVFLSPYSISTALAMTYAGAGGETAAQMAKVLHFEPPPDRLHATFGLLIRDLNEGGKKGAYQLNVANALWGRQGEEFRPEFVELVKKHYEGALRTLDFAGNTEGARQTINAWVEDRTAHKIKDLIGPGVLQPSTSLVLTNAIYFKGNWACQFKKDQTKDEPFLLADDKKVDSPLMHQTGQFRYAEDADCQVLELSYAGDEVAMMILLPRKVDGLPALERRLTTEGLTPWGGKLTRREVVVALPKFKLTWEARLNEPLRDLGMAAAFRGGFEGMVTRGSLFISAVVHKAFVDVNEEGTEAAAATGAIMMRTAVVPQPPTIFRADRPFLFVIRHVKTESILFIGRLTNPRT
ncbi:MAG TPA: serpin family protein [Phycisphaerae bacterium]|nr:serpin family protein [Phycisphaerae bacterium]